MDSLHTKYRPTTFKEVHGHENVKKSLIKVLKDGRQHAFIFTGPAGIGKTTLARIAANYICGKKATVHNIEEIPAATHTGVDSMRTVIERSRYKAIGASRKKVIILDEAHRLSGNAWDSLLKEIEEPSPHVYWMLATTNESKIPQTVKTRCVTYDLKPLSEDEIVSVLKEVAEKENIEIDAEIFETIADSSGGSARQALVYLESCAYCETVSEARTIMRKAGQTKEIIDLARYLVSGRAVTWPEIIKILNDLKGTEAESVRIVMNNYVASVLLNTKDVKKAQRLIVLLECFSTPYNQSDKFAPLILSIGEFLFGED